MMKPKADDRSDSKADDQSDSIGCALKLVWLYFVNLSLLCSLFFKYILRSYLA